MTQEIISWELTYPRFVHADLMTHRMFSRNGASSRAIPVKRMIAEVIRNPAIPVIWGANGSGMQSRRELGRVRRWLARRVWLLARWPAVFSVWLLLRIGLHKQWANRIIEPWLHMTVIVTATEHENFLKLRDHETAQPDIGVLAAQMRALRGTSVPQILLDGEWHIPLLTDDERKHHDLCLNHIRSGGQDSRAVAISITHYLKVATARAARISYVTHEMMRDPKEDVRLHDRLIADGHWSPFEHCARADSKAGWVGNFFGWTQYRKLFPNESGRSTP